MEITFSICGTAGRGDDGKRLSLNHFKAMKFIAEGLLEQFETVGYKVDTLVSGGAAWADATAVRIFLDKKVPNLRLFLPDLWDNGSYHDTGEKDPYKNPGGTANYYHGLFQRKTGINSLSDIQIAQAHGAQLIDCNRHGKPLGFYARNALVAKSDFILACTFGDRHKLKEGGTADTIRKYLAHVHKEDIFDKSFHYDLTSGKVYEGCQVPADPKDKKEEMFRLAKQMGIPGQPIGIHFFPPSP